MLPFYNNTQKIGHKQLGGKSNKYIMAKQVRQGMNQ